MKLTKFSQKFSFFITTQCVWKNEKLSVTTEKKISSNQRSSNFFSKTITFTKFFEKIVRERNVRRNCCDLVSHIFGKNFVKIADSLYKLLKS